MEVILFAACVLAMVEVAYEYHSSGVDIDYIVASEGYDPMPGFPWDDILIKLTAEPAMPPLNLAVTLVDEHLDYYDVKHQGEVGPYEEEIALHGEDAGTAWWNMSYEFVTFSVIDLPRMDELVSDIKDMASAIMLEMDDYVDVVSQARLAAVLSWSQNGWERTVDLPTLVAGIHEKSLDPVKSTSGNVMVSLSEAIIYHRSLNERSGYEGMGVFFPKSLAMYENCQVYNVQWPMPQWSEYYGQMLFADEVWLDFLHAYWDSIASEYSP